MLQADRGGVGLGALLPHGVIGVGQRADRGDQRRLGLRAQHIGKRRHGHAGRRALDQRAAVDLAEARKNILVVHAGTSRWIDFSCPHAPLPAADSPLKGATNLLKLVRQPFNTITIPFLLTLHKRVENVPAKRLASASPDSELSGRKDARLYRRRRGVGRLRSGRPAERGSERVGHADRGRPA